MVVDLQLVRRPQPRHRHPGRDGRFLRRQSGATTACTPPGTAMLETAERLVDDEQSRPSSSSCCWWERCGPSPSARTPRAWCWTPTCCARWPSRATRRLLRGLRPVRVAGAARRVRARSAGAACARAARPGRRPPRRDGRAAGGAAPGDWASAEATDGRHRRRPHGSWRPTASSTSSAVCARCGSSSGHEPSGPRAATPVSRPAAAPLRGPPAGDPGRVRAAARRGRHGRQRPLGQASAGCPAPRVTRRGRRPCSTSSRAPSRSASSTSRRTPSPPRTGSGRRTRCGSSWASTAT